MVLGPARLQVDCRVPGSASTRGCGSNDGAQLRGGSRLFGESHVGVNLERGVGAGVPPRDLEPGDQLAHLEEKRPRRRAEGMPVDSTPLSDNLDRGCSLQVS